MLSLHAPTHTHTVSFPNTAWKLLLFQLSLLRGLLNSPATANPVDAVASSAGASQQRLDIQFAATSVAAVLARHTAEIWENR